MNIFQPVFRVMIFILFFISTSCFAQDLKKETNDKFPTYFSNDEMLLDKGNDAVIGLGLGLHRIKAGEAIGVYLSGIIPISNTNFGVYGRSELIRDKYKTGYFWSWKMSVGAGYYFNDDLIITTNVGKCFSNYSTCYFNFRHPTANDDDIDAIYYGFGFYYKEPIFNQNIEISFDWSPYQNYNGSSLYLGYAFKF